MKTTRLILALTVAALVAACGTHKNEQKEGDKILVLYYSQTSNTKAVAEEIASRLGADIEEIVAVEPYDSDFQATIERCQLEREQEILPTIQPVKADLASYDVIFLGYPVWFGTFAPPVAAFLTSADLSGKKVVPFCTFGSGGLESSVRDLTERQPNAEILPGYGVRAARLEAMPAEIDQFLKANGFLEGEYTELEAFSDLHPVTEEETAIFNAAVGDYPMMHANATEVASRAIPGGTEYRFTAVDQPREDRPNPPAPQPAGKKPDLPAGKKPLLPPAGELMVFVTVANGQPPVFTRVVR